MVMSESLEEENSLRDRLDEFRDNSLVIPDFKPYVLRRVDRYNIRVSETKASKSTGEEYESDSNYYGRLNYALRGLLRKIIKTDKLPSKDSFEKYKDNKAESCTKELYDEVIQEVKVQLKLEKENLKRRT